MKTLQETDRPHPKTSAKNEFPQTVQNDEANVQAHSSIKKKKPTVSYVVATVQANEEKEEELNNINNNKQREQDAFLSSFPPGYRFNPRDEELVQYYLRKKIMDEPLPPNKIMQVNLYRHNPETLADRYGTYGEKEWYFFTPRDRKYRNGNRPNRAAGDGYWKATGADKPIKTEGVKVPIGFRKALVFYRGKPPKGTKTNWIMHEYRVSESRLIIKRNENDMRLDNWVLCRIYEKAKLKNSKCQLQNHEEDPGDELVHESSAEDIEEETPFPEKNQVPPRINIVHSPVEYEYYYPRGQPVCGYNNMGFNPEVDNNAYMGLMQPAALVTPLSLHYSEHKFRPESVTYYSEEKFTIKYPGQTCVDAFFHEKNEEPIGADDIRQQMMPSFAEKKRSQSLPCLAHPHQGSDHGLLYMEESNEDHNIMFSLPPVVSLDNLQWT